MKEVRVELHANGEPYNLQAVASVNVLSDGRREDDSREASRECIHGHWQQSARVDGRQVEHSTKFEYTRVPRRQEV